MFGCDAVTRSQSERSEEGGGTTSSVEASIPEDLYIQVGAR